MASLLVCLYIFLQYPIGIDQFRASIYLYLESLILYSLQFFSISMAPCQVWPRPSGIHLSLCRKRFPEQLRLIAASNELGRGHIVTKQPKYTISKKYTTTGCVVVTTISNEHEWLRTDHTTGIHHHIHHHHIELCVHHILPLLSCCQQR